MTPEVIQYSRILDAYQEFYLNFAVSVSEGNETPVHILYYKLSNELNLDTNRYTNDDRNLDWHLWCSCAEIRGSVLGYSIKDMDGDGIPELIILSEDYTVHAIYSLSGDVPILIDAYWPRHSCVIGENGELYTHSSSGAGDWYFSYCRVVDSSPDLQLIEQFGIESFDPQTYNTIPSRCYRVHDGIKEIIDYEEFETAFSEFPGFSTEITEKAGLCFIPFSVKAD